MYKFGNYVCISIGAISLVATGYNFILTENYSYFLFLFSVPLSWFFIFGGIMDLRK